MLLSWLIFLFAFLAQVLFLKFEDMKLDLPTVVRQLAQFIGVSDLTEEQVDSIARQVHESNSM